MRIINIRSLFSPKAEQKTSLKDSLLSGAVEEVVVVNTNTAMSIPAVSASVNYIAERVASINVKLYKREADGSVKEVKTDKRTKLLNKESGGVVTSFNMKFNMVQDLLLQGRSHLYVEKQGIRVKSLRYVEPANVTVLTNNDILFRQIQYSVNGKTYDEDDFVSIINTKDGVNFIGLVNQNKTLLESCLYMLKNNKVSAKTLNIPKGIVESEIPLGDEELEILKANIKRLYSGNAESSMVLNQGVSWKSIGNTSQANQTIEQQRLLDEQIYNIFGVSAKLINGEADAQAEELFLKSKLYPLLDKIRDEYNRILLLESEKESMFFEFDLTELSKIGFKERYEAYQIAIKNNILDVNEVRAIEKLPANKAFDGVIKFGLQDVLYDVNTRTSTILNLGKSVDSKGMEVTSDAGGGEVVNNGI